MNCSLIMIMCLDTSYLTDSYIIFTLKMKSVSKTTIFDLKMMVKSGLEKISFIYSKQIFLDHFSPSFLGQKLWF